MDWTKQQIQLLRRLVVEENASNARLREEIAKTSRQKVTKGMIAGKIMSLGLSGRRSRKLKKVTEAKNTAAPRKTRQSRKETLAPGIAATRTAAPSGSTTQSPVLATSPMVAVDETSPAPITTGMATILTLGLGMCKWPIGDPGREDFCFCGRNVGEKLSSGKFPNYCPTHRSNARRPEPTGRRRGGGDRIGRVVAYYS